MDDPTISDREYHERRRIPNRVPLPVWASVAIAVVVLVVAAVTLKPKSAVPDAEKRHPAPGRQKPLRE